MLALFTTAGQWPNGLRYCNRFWGGSERASERLVDSNGDWGQGLPELRRWAEAQSLERLPVWYYGADPGVWNAPFQLVPVNHWPNPTIAELKRTVGPDGLLAVGLSLLNGCPDRRPETLAVIEWLKGQPRRATVGTFAVMEID